MLSRLSPTLRSSFVRAFSTSSVSSSSEVLKNLGLADVNSGVFTGTWAKDRTNTVKSFNPATNTVLGEVTCATADDVKQAVDISLFRMARWQELPMPKRGEIIRQIGNELRRNKDNLGKLISMEMGKILSEGLGEVQEAIDICDFACGLSRTIAGQVLPSERPNHFMMERWNPLNGPVGVITAFNFPLAVYFWNFAISMVCGNLNMWKPHQNTSLIAVASTKIIEKVLRKNKVTPALSTLLVGDGDIGRLISGNFRVPLVSFTGSERTGRLVNLELAKRFARPILELGGNNAMIVTENANQNLALRACLFAAVGTAGQRCTSLRRLMVAKPIYEKFTADLAKAYKSVRIGDPLHPDTLMGPLFNQAAVDLFTKTVEEFKSAGCRVLTGGNTRPDIGPNYVEPTIIEVADMTLLPKLSTERFVPILFVIPFETVQQAIKINNAVPQGLASSMFTDSVSQSMLWTGPRGSDCGIVNVNIGPSGAEIGGAFGGEKSTGGGRESGSDSWKQYMRRSTCTINHGDSLPLAQGVKFDIEEGDKKAEAKANSSEADS